MKVKVVGARPAPEPVRHALALIFARRPRQRVARRQIPYWQETGWRRSGSSYSGLYQSPQGRIAGFVDGRGRNLEFFINQPPQALKRHSHWVCFQDRGNGWYRVHMARRPADLSSGILTVERLLGEALKK